MIKVKHFMKENALYRVSQQSIPRTFYSDKQDPFRPVQFQGNVS